MHLRGKINHIRQIIIWKLTKNIGLSREKEDEVIAYSEIRKILVNRPNHRLGNTLLVTPLIQEVVDTFPAAEIDLFVKGKVAPIVLRNYGNINRFIQLPAKPFLHLFQYLAGWVSIRTRRYDLVINGAHHSSSGRLSTRFAKAKHKFYGDPDEYTKEKRDDYKHSAKYPVYGLRQYLDRCGIKTRKDPVSCLDLRLDSAELAHGKKLLAALVPDNKKTICLFTFATGTKLYPTEWWNSFYERLRVVFSDYNFIEVLPLGNTSQISASVPSFYSKDIREIGSVIANTDLFIGADSGIMHLASAVQTSTVGLFKVTDPETFGPYGNHSVAIDTNKGTVDDWIEIVGNVVRNSRMNVQLRGEPGLTPG